MPTYEKPVYKVENIEQTMGTDGKPRWVIHFEGKKVTLTEDEPEPCCKVGGLYPYEIELVKPDKGKWYYKKRGDTTQVSRPAETKPTTSTGRMTYKNDDDIMLQVAFKGAIELETHHVVPEGKIDTGRVIQATSELFAGLVLMRPTRDIK